MNRNEQVACIVLGGAVIVGLLYSCTLGGQAPLTLVEKSVGNSYDPYIHWTHGGGGTWVHRYPSTIGATCLGQAIQEEDLGLAMRGVDVSGGGYGE